MIQTMLTAHSVNKISVKHQRQAKFVSCNRKISPAPLKKDEQVKEMELQLAVGITCHSSIMAVENLGEIMAQHGKGSKMDKIKLPRTKCSLLINY